MSKKLYLTSKGEFIFLGHSMRIEGIKKLTHAGNIEGMNTGGNIE